MAVHRFLYGVVFIAAILMSRNLLAAPGADGLAVFGSILGVLGAGSTVAVVVTPVLGARTGPHRWIVLCLVLAAVAQLVLAATTALAAVLVVAGLIGLAAQGAKIAIDTIVQRDTHDDYRGRAFALYDVLYNAAFVGAAALAALALPDTGHSPGVFVALAVVYLVTATLYRAGARRDASLTPPPTTSPRPAAR
jgi:MFS family permease